MILVTNGTAATDFNNVVARIELSGIQFDKLDQFYYDAINDQTLQDIDFIAYDVNTISTANATDYNLFVQDSTKPSTDQSITFPLSANQRFQVNAMRAYFYGDDADTDFMNLLIDNRGQNYLTISVDSVQFFQGSLYDFLSLGSIRGTTFDNSGGVNTTDTVSMDFIWREKIIKVPLIIPASSNQNVVLSQPGSSLSVNNEFITVLKGFIKRQVI